MGRCRFNRSWLTKDDGQGHLLSKWGAASSDNDHTVICKICDGLPEINVKSARFQALKQHASTAGHKACARDKLDSAQQRLSLTKGPASTAAEGPCTADDASGSGARTETIRLYSVRDTTTTSELIWCMLGVANNWSFSSNQHAPDCFRAMFHCPVDHSFTMSPTKTMYLITEALGPYFEEQQEDMKGAHYSLSYDETCNSGGRKELQTYIRYWCRRSGKVVCKHLRTSSIGKATTRIIHSNLHIAMDKGALSISNMVMLSSDGPNVNKSVLNMMNEDYKKDTRNKPLIDVCFCNLHVVHNSYEKGLSEFGRDVSDLIFDMNRYFLSYPSRWEDFDNLKPKDSTEPTPRFIKHCLSRWLTLGLAAKRLLLMWDQAEKYFIEYIPKQKNSKQITESKAYRRIKSALESRTMKAQVMFIISTSDVFEDILKFFQKEKPLTHALYDQLLTLLRVLIGRACKLVTPSMKDFREDNFLPLESVVIVDDTKEALKNVSEKEFKVFVMSARRHYEACCRYLLEKAPVSSDSIVACFKCLQPGERRSEHSKTDIARLASQLPFHVSKDRLIDEWNLLQQEPDKESEDGRIDSYWKQFFDKKGPGGSGKYPLVTKVVKASLTVFHGNSDVERGFSTSQRVLTEDRAAISERTLNAILTVKGGLHVYGNRPHLVPITRDLIRMARCAHLLTTAMIIIWKTKGRLGLSQLRKPKKRQTKELWKKRVLKSSKKSGKIYLK